MAERASRPVAAVLLAAGLSRRFGSNKLLHLIDGRPMLRRVAENLVAALLPQDEVVVVLGHQAEAVRAALDGLPVRCIVNENYADGMGGSIAAGVSGVGDKAAGVMIMLGDMPWIGAGQIRALRAAFDKAAADAVVLPVHQGRRGHPVIFSRRWFPALCALRGDRGARSVLDAAGNDVIEVAMPDDGILRDLDQPDAV